MTDYWAVSQGIRAEMEGNGLVRVSYGCVQWAEEVLGRHLPAFAVLTRGVVYRDLNNREHKELHSFALVWVAVLYHMAAAQEDHWAIRAAVLLRQNRKLERKISAVARLSGYEVAGKLLTGAM